MVLAFAPLTDRLAPLAFEVDTCRVEEQQFETAEEVARLLKERLLDEVLDRSSTVAAGFSTAMWQKHGGFEGSCRSEAGFVVP
jgi:hypothetical protein